MNLTAGRIFVRLRTWTNVTPLLNRETPCVSRIRNVQVRTRTKLSSYEIKANEKESWYQRDQNIGAFGYFLLTIPIGSFLLGTWQTQRYKWKLNLIENLNHRFQQEPIPLPENLEEIDSLEYQHVKVRGTFLHDKEFTIGPRHLVVDGKVAADRSNFITSHSPQRGYCVITPFKLADRDLTILVNRGWVPAKYKNPETREVGQVQGEVEITGAVRPNEKRPPLVPKNNPKNGQWFYRDVNQLAELAGTAPIYIEMSAQKEMTGVPIGGQTRISVRNEHMSYIITWYAISAVTAYMWYKVIIKKFRIR